MIWQNRPLARVVCVVAAIGLSIGEARAQAPAVQSSAAQAAAPPQADDLGTWRTPAVLGDTLRIETGDGTVHKGILADLQRASLTIIEHGTRREFAGPDVRRITRENPDSLANGARNGAIAGAAFIGTLAVLAAAEGEHLDGGMAVTTMFVYAGIGAAIGAGIDAAIRDRTVIYTAPTAPRTRVAVTPLVSPRAAGVTVRVVW